MNPTLRDSYLEHAKLDPAAYASEVEGQFRAGVSALFTDAMLDAVVDSGVTVRPPRPGVDYRAFVDAASGGGSDAFATAVAHDEGGVAVLDALLVRRPPFSAVDAVRESAAFLGEYRLQFVEGDAYAGGRGGGVFQDMFRLQGLHYRVSERDRSAIYRDLLPLVTSGQVRLLDDPVLLREARGLVRSPGQKVDRIDHRRGAHDDAVNACGGALTVARLDAREPLLWVPAWGGEPFLRYDPKTDTHYDEHGEVTHGMVRPARTGPGGFVDPGFWIDAERGPRYGFDGWASYYVDFRLLPEDERRPWESEEAFLERRRR
jgi:hypothetical protein